MVPGPPVISRDQNRSSVKNHTGPETAHGDGKFRRGWLPTKVAYMAIRPLALNNYTTLQTNGRMRERQKRKKKDWHG